MSQIVVTLTQDIALGPQVAKSGVHLGNGKLMSPFLEGRWHVGRYLAKDLGNRKTSNLSRKVS